VTTGAKTEGRHDGAISYDCAAGNLTAHHPAAGSVLAVLAFIAYSSRPYAHPR